MTRTLPALTWLIKHDPDAALAVFHRLRDEHYSWGPEPQPTGREPLERNADDVETHDAPEAELTSESMSEPTQDGPDETWPEMLHEVKPDIHAILRSAGGIAWPWCGVRRKRDGKVRWVGEPWAYQYQARPVSTGRHLVSLGGLTFYTKPNARRGIEGGMLLEYVDDAGCTQRPILKANKPRGGKRPHRDNPAGYLALPGVVESPLAAAHHHRPFSNEPVLGPMLDPQAGTEEARAILREHGVDGRVPFDRLPFPAKKLPDAIAKNARFIGGMSGRCQTASPGTVGRWEPADPISAATAGVVEEVAARGTLQSIGIKLGYRGGYADRAGGKALLAAGRALVAANQNLLPEKKIAA